MIIAEIQRKNIIKGIHFMSTCSSFTVHCCGKVVNVNLDERSELREQASHNRLYVGCVHCSKRKQVPHYLVQNIKFPLHKVGHSLRRTIG